MRIKRFGNFQTMLFICICVLREFLEFKKIVRRFKDCIKTGDGVRAKKSRYPYPQFSYLENVV